jgi:GH18 family chitinase
MRNQNRIIVTLLLLVILAGCTKKDVVDPPPQPPVVRIGPPPDFGFKIIGYFPYYRDPSAVPDIKFRMTNVVNYAFFTVNASGGLVLNNPSVFASVVAKSKANNARIFMSVSGSEANFKSMASTAPGRNDFIKQIMNNVRQYQLHGVDMDWEFPRTTDGTDVTFTALMKELSDSCHLDAKYYVTAAITAGKYVGAVRDAIKSELFDYIDWFNVMAYDDFNTTVPFRHHSDFALAQTSVNYWVTTRGMPKSKFILGIPAYGRPSGISQTNTVLSYAQILSQGGNPQADSATVNSIGSPTPYTIYYNGQPTVKRKAMLAKQAGNGVMMWEKWHDSHDGNSLLKAICDTIGRSY